MVGRGSHYRDKRRRRHLAREIGEQPNLTCKDLRRWPIFCDIFKIPHMEKVFQRGECLYRSGGSGGYLIIVESGWVAQRFEIENGSHCITDFCLPGDIFGVFQQGAAVVPHTAACLSKVSACWISYSRLLARAETAPELRDFLSRCAVCREYRAYDHIANITMRDSRGRVAHLLFELYCRTTHACPERAGDEIRIPLRLADIGEAVGLTSVHVSRTLGILRSAQVIDLQRGQMTVINPDRWRQIAGDLLVPLTDPLAGHPH